MGQHSSLFLLGLAPCSLLSQGSDVYFSARKSQLIHFSCFKCLADRSLTSILLAILCRAKLLQLGMLAVAVNLQTVSSLINIDMREEYRKARVNEWLLITG